MTIIFPSGAFGGSDEDPPLEKFLRRVALKFAKPDEWADKYGTEFENEVFMMHPYCWCWRAGCPWCAEDTNDRIMNQKNTEGKSAPNFHHKPSGFKVWWYKYIGRGMDQSEPLSAELLTKMESDIFGTQTRHKD